MFYLTSENWSPRFDENFFTVNVRSRRQVDDPTEEMPAKAQKKIPGRECYPAVFFEIQVLCGHKEHVCYRRYSQFRWLYDSTMASPPKQPEGEGAAGANKLQRLSMPPKTPCMFRGGHDEDFLDTRQEELGDFLSDMLRRGGYSEHPAVVAFLDLDELSIRSETTC